MNAIVNHRVEAQADIAKSQHGLIYWTIVDVEDEAVLADIGCYEGAQDAAVQMAYRWNNYLDMGEMYEKLKEGKNA